MNIYRFLNSNNEVIYIGKTSRLEKRQENHNHLPKECYNETVKIEYIELSNNDETSIYEIYLINKFNPKYNIQYKNNSKFCFELPEREWKEYEYKNAIKKYHDLVKYSVIIPIHSLEYVLKRTKGKSFVSIDGKNIGWLCSPDRLIDFLKELNLKFVPMLYDINNKCHYLCLGDRVNSKLYIDFHDYCFSKKIKIDEEYLQDNINYEMLQNKIFENLLKDVEVIK